MRWAAICALALLPGCSLGGDEEPEQSSGARVEIAALVRQLELATQRRDAAQVCRDLLTRAARERMGGERCGRRVGRALAGVGGQVGAPGDQVARDGVAAVGSGPRRSNPAA